MGKLDLAYDQGPLSSSHHYSNMIGRMNEDPKCNIDWISVEKTPNLDTNAIRVYVRYVYVDCVSRADVKSYSPPWGPLVIYRNFVKFIHSPYIRKVMNLGPVYIQNLRSCFPVFLIEDQPSPEPSTGDIWELVMDDMLERRKLGIQRYGTPLQAHNGRDALVDAYQEALDLCVYLRQAIEERRIDGS